MNGKVILNTDIKDMDKPCPDLTEISSLVDVWEGISP
jgi:hypothetical protein